MNTIAQSAQKAGQTLRDVTPAKTSPPASPPANAPVKPVLVAEIPVQSPIAKAPTANSQQNPMAGSATSKREEEDKDLDKILQDVTTSVKKAEDSRPGKPEPASAAHQASPTKRVAKTHH